MIDNAKPRALPRQNENPPPGNQRRVFVFGRMASGETEPRANLWRGFQSSRWVILPQTCHLRVRQEVPVEEESHS